MSLPTFAVGDPISAGKFRALAREVGRARRANGGIKAPEKGRYTPPRPTSCYDLVLKEEGLTAVGGPVVMPDGSVYELADAVLPVQPKVDSDGVGTYPDLELYIVPMTDGAAWWAEWRYKLLEEKK